ncbi:unnamed protein product [Adineta ricciae]|uniref:TLDc domain-containing protein n=1 Tax=Adineta ricciae TaxID=249248 RepID=A0A814QQJ9_ADIRI|nr:unnamed protein product [Adineta ricciae]
MAAKSITLHELCKTQLSELKQKKTELEQLKTELTTIQTKYNQCLNDYELKLQQFYLQTDALQQEQEEKEANLINATTEWLDIKAKLGSTTASLNQKVKLNIGGTYYESTISTLTKYTSGNNAYFKALFSRQWHLEKDSKDESIFIDRDGYLFGFILQYLRTGRITIDEKCDLLQRDLALEADFYGLSSLTSLLNVSSSKVEQPSQSQQETHSKNLYSGTNILSVEYQQQLNNLFGCENQQWQLIYSASRDGYTAKAFHQICDSCWPTMTVIRSKNGFIFGGFTTVAWSSTTQYRADALAFLFTLKNPHNIEPTKYVIREQAIRFAVSHLAKDGPIFGSNCNGAIDLYLKSPFNANGNRTFFPQTYRDTTEKNRTTFTGDPYFSCDDVEVFCPV